MPKNKTILHLLSTNRLSGAENVACTIIDLMKNDYNSYYCSPDGDIRQSLNNKKIHYVKIDSFSYRGLKKIISTYKPDIIHAHDYRASILSASFSKKAKIVSHIHQDNDKVKKLSLESIAYYIASKKISKIIWVSQDSFSNYYFSKKIKTKSIVLKNIVNESTIRKLAKNEEHIDNTDLLFVGRLIEIKNPLLFIKIVGMIKKKIPGIKAAIIGRGEQENIIINEIKNKSLNKNIKLLGYKENPYPYIKNTKIVLMTSKTEGTPMVLLESLCLGKPVVSTDVGDNKKIIRNNYNGYISNEPKEIMDKIIDYLDDKKYKIIAKNSVKSFKKINNINEYKRIIKNVYER